MTCRAEGAPHYFFPRDCPRVIYWKADWTTEEDRHELFRDTFADKIVAVENRWLDRIRSTKLYVYTFPGESFRVMEEALTAGYYISNEVIVPIRVKPVGDLLERLLAEPLELRFTPSLVPIRNRVVASTADFSIIRFKNACKEDILPENEKRG